MKAAKKANIKSRYEIEFREAPHEGQMDLNPIQQMRTMNLQSYFKKPLRK